VTEAEIEAVAITTGLLLDQLQDRGGEGDALIRNALAAIGDLLAERGGIALMSQVLERVLDQKPEAEGFREGVLDAAFSGFAGWGS